MPVHRVFRNRTLSIGEELILLYQANSTDPAGELKAQLRRLENRLTAYYGQRPTLHLRVLLT
jgi:hypothetical protein